MLPTRRSKVDFEKIMFFSERQKGRPKVVVVLCVF
jgi:hypothetical protein